MNFSALCKNEGRDGSQQQNSQNALQHGNSPERFRDGREV
jgi:hypothetical protein